MFHILVQPRLHRIAEIGILPHLHQMVVVARVVMSPAAKPRQPIPCGNSGATSALGALGATTAPDAKSAHSAPPPH